MLDGLIVCGRPLSTLEVIQFEMVRHSKKCLKCREIEKANAWVEYVCDEWSILCKTEDQLKQCTPSAIEK
jgi:hypothetical protein